MKNDIFEMQSEMGRDIDLPRLSVLIAGDTEHASTVKRQLEENTALSVQVLIRSNIEDGLVLLSSDTSIALVLLLWTMESAERLPNLLRSILERQCNPMLAVMVRSQAALTEQIRAGLWHLGVADHSFAQNIPSAELIDSVALAIRNYRRQLTLSGIPALSKVFSGAKTMRDLALMSLLAIEEKLPVISGGAFCNLGKSAEHKPMLIAGAGCHENYSCIPLAQIEDVLVKRMMQNALDRCRSQFDVEGAAIYLHTPGGYTVCLYFSLSLPLRTLEIDVLQSICGMIATAIDHLQLAQQLLRTQHATITGMSALAEYRDTDTGEHIARVARMTTEIAQILYDEAGEDADIDAQFLEQIGRASTLHDTGKIAIPDNILLKPGVLDQHERQTMQQHVTLGYDVLIRAARLTDNGELLKMAAEIARYHHERFDGKGYPEGLKGEEIPIAARIVSIVDVYDALTSKRPYKLVWQHEDAVELIRKESGSHFDPRVVDAFLRLDDIKKANRHIEWSDDMSVSHADLDADHRQLIEIINRLWMAESMGNRQIIEFVLDDLVNYTEFHFAREEQLLGQSGFPDLERHSSIHKGICRQLEEIRMEYFDGIRDDLRNGLLEFLTVWLNNHILEEDMQYSEFFTETAAALSSKI